MLKVTWHLYKIVVVAPLLVLTMYSTGLSELQLATLGYIAIQPWHLSALFLLGLIVGWVVFSGRTGRLSFGVSQPLVAFYAIYALYLVFSWILAFRFDLPLRYMLALLVDHVGWIFVIGMVVLQPSTRERVTDTRSTHALMGVLSIVTLFLMILAVLQFWSQSLIVVPMESLASNDETSPLVSVADFYGQIRAVSAFSSPNVFGQYLLFFTVLWLAMMRQEEHQPATKVVLGILVVFSAVVMYMTLTRSNYLLLICAVLAYILIVRGFRPWILCTLTFAFSFLAFGIFLAVTANTTLLGQQGITSIASSVSRLQDWDRILGEFLFEGDVIGVLFGYGLRTGDVFEVSIDNSFLGSFLLNGFVGLLLWIIFLAWTLSVVIRRAQVSGSPVWLATASYLVAFLIGANYQNLLNVYGFLVLAFLLLGNAQWDTTVGYRRRGVSAGRSRGSEPNIPQPLRKWQGPGSQANAGRREVAESHGVVADPACRRVAQRLLRSVRWPAQFLSVANTWLFAQRKGALRPLDNWSDELVAGVPRPPREWDAVSGPSNAGFRDYRKG